MSKTPLDINHPAIGWNSEERYFGCELSSISLNHIDTQCHRHEPITLINSETGKTKLITWYKDDKDGSNEDTYGFHYEGFGDDGKRFTFLFIND